MKVGKKALCIGLVGMMALLLLSGCGLLPAKLMTAAPAEISTIFIEDLASGHSVRVDGQTLASADGLLLRDFAAQFETKYRREQECTADDPHIYRVSLYRAGESGGYGAENLVVEVELNGDGDVCCSGGRHVQQGNSEAPLRIADWQALYEAHHAVALSGVLAAAFDDACAEIALPRYVAVALADGESLPEAFLGHAAESCGASGAELLAEGGMDALREGGYLTGEGAAAQFAEGVLFTFTVNALTDGVATVDAMLYFGAADGRTLYYTLEKTDGEWLAAGRMEAPVS